MSWEHKKTNTKSRFVMKVTLVVTAMMVLMLSGIATADHIKDAEKLAPSDSSEIYSVVEIMPEIEGGIQSVYDNVKYPPLAAKNGLEGKVFVKFIVDENGNVSNPEILKDIGGGCGEAVLNGIVKVKFTPGEQDGKKVKVYFTMPINFKLD